MSETVTRDGAVLPVQVRAARKQHPCNDCDLPILPGDKYELAVYRRTASTFGTWTAG